jgi:hypothetical protein
MAAFVKVDGAVIAQSDAVAPVFFGHNFWGRLGEAAPYRYVEVYNRHNTQKALGHITPL